LSAFKEVKMLKRFSIIVAFLLPLLPIVLLLTMNGRALSNEATRVERLQPVSATQLNEIPIGQEVLIEGQIDRQTITKYRTFVAYIQAGCYVDNDLSVYCGSGVPRGSPLLIGLTDGLVHVVNDNYAIQNPTGVWYERDKASRYSGFQRGDRVLVVGTLTNTAGEIAIRADLVAGGTRAEYLAAQPSGTLPMVMLAIGSSAIIGLALIAIVAWRRSRRAALMTVSITTDDTDFIEPADDTDFTETTDDTDTTE
jgi:hypothetical protein